MVARHGDAELIAGVLSRFGMSLIRGAGAGYRRRNRGGAAALRGALKALEQGTTVAMTEALGTTDRALRHGDEPLHHAQ